MKNLFKDKSFVIGVLTGLLIIGLLNKFTADFSQVTEEYTYRQLYGFPFLQYEKCKGLVSITRRYWLGMFGNSLFAIVFSLIIGLIFRFARSKFKKLK